MSFSLGIVGLPNAGKSTLFSALTKKQAEIKNFPFTTIDPNIGVVAVPDNRLQKLADLNQSEKITPTTIEFVDIAGLVKGASQGEGLGNKFLANIREVDAIIQVVRIFPDANITHVYENVDPSRDREIINTELILADLDSAEKHRRKIADKAKGGIKEFVQEQLALDKLIAHLKKGGLAIDCNLDDEEKLFLRQLMLLTDKPMMYVVNVSEEQLKNKVDLRFLPDPTIAICAKLENEIQTLPEEEAAVFLNEFGLSQSGLDSLIQTGYELLSLITFFTAGPKETKAWTIQKGQNAVQAAGKIHTDIAEGFIKAEVIDYQNYIDCGSELQAKNSGQMHLEGKDYLMKDGDVIYFRFNQ